MLTFISFRETSLLLPSPEFLSNTVNLDISNSRGFISCFFCLYFTITRAKNVFRHTEVPLYLLSDHSNFLFFR